MGLADVFTAYHRLQRSAFPAAELQVIQSAADAGDSDARAWLAGEGFIKVSRDLQTGEHSARFVYWEEWLYSRYSPEARQWSLQVMERDGFRCRECGAKGKLQAHHIKPWATFPAYRFDVSNGLTLCPDCHAEKHPRHANLIRKSRYHRPRV